MKKLDLLETTVEAERCLTGVLHAAEGALSAGDFARAARRTFASRELRSDALLYAAIKWAKPRHILEIGTFHGLTACVLDRMQRELVGESSVLSVDIKRSDLAPKVAAACGARVDFVEGDRDNPFVADRGEYGVVLIDGDHTAEGVAADWRAIEGLLADRSVVIFDDLLHPEGCGGWIADNVPDVVELGRFGYVVRDAAITRRRPPAGAPGA